MKGFTLSVAVATGVLALAATPTVAQPLDPTPAVVRLRARQFVPPDRREQPRPERADVERTGEHRLLQFDIPFSPALSGALTARGIRPLRYVPDRAVLAWVPATVDLDTLPDLRWDGRLEPSDKISDDSLDILGATATSHVVVFHSDVETLQSERAVMATGARARRHARLGSGHLVVDATREQLWNLATDDRVAWIFPASEALTGGGHATFCPFLREASGLPLADFAIHDEGWDGPGLGQAILGYYFGTGAGLGGAEWGAVDRALREWANHAALRWVPRTFPRERESIDLSWQLACHSEATGEPSDPCFSSNVLAHAYFPSADEPIAGDVHFNRQHFRWKLSGLSDDDVINVFDVALHEIGHSLGLAHSSDPGAVMYAYLERTFSGLTNDDIRAIQSIYQPAPFCEFTVTPTQRVVTANAGSVSFSVTTIPGCAWTFSSSVRWIRTPASATGSGSGTATFVVDENPLLSSRTGEVTVAGIRVVVHQEAPPCTFSLTATPWPFATNSLGFGDGLTITTQPTCTWTLRITEPWVWMPRHFRSGTGSVTVPYVIPPNVSSVARSVRFEIGQAFFVVTQSGSRDSDNNGLLDGWEFFFGNPTLDPARDDDHDGASNLAEQAAGTHPRGFFSRTFAEGATSAFFTTRFSILQTDVGIGSVLFTFLRSDGQRIRYPVQVRGGLAVVEANEIPGLANAEFSTVVESNFVVSIDRTMVWDRSGYGSHTETSIPGPATTWYLAEGATHSRFQLFYLLQNSSATDATVRVEYLLPAPRPPVVKTYRVAAQSRFTVWVNSEPELAAVDTSAIITSDVPIVVERAMYLDRPGQPFGAGHESAGVTAPAQTWFFAEGATGRFFDTFLLIANPGVQSTSCDVRFLLPNGTVSTLATTVDGRSRHNVWIDAVGGALADTAVSTTLTCDRPVVAERSMWWPGPGSDTWAEAHNTFGVTSSGTLWGIADGEQGGPMQSETYLLIANTSPFAASVRVSAIVEGTGSYDILMTVAANSRTNVAVGAPTASGGFGSLVQNRRFGITVESLPDTTAGIPAQIVVERSLYSNAGGVAWAAGSNSLGTKLR